MLETKRILFDELEIDEVYQGFYLSCLSLKDIRLECDESLQPKRSSNIDINDPDRFFKRMVKVKDKRRAKRWSKHRRSKELRLMRQNFKTTHRIFLKANKKRNYVGRAIVEG